MSNLNSPDRLDVERRCVATLLLSAADVVSASAQGLRTDHFENPLCRAIHRDLLAAVQSAPGSIPFEVLYGQTRASASRYTSADLSDIAGLESMTTYRDNYIASVIALWRRSKLLESLAKAGEAAKAGTATDWPETWSAVTPHLSAITDLTAEQRVKQFSEFCAEYIEQQRHPEKIKTVAIGLPTWDRLASPIKIHELVTIAGRPGTGKTALALQLTNHLAGKRGENVAFFSLEMTGNELIDRLAKHRAGPNSVGDHPYEVSLRIAEADRLRELKTFHVFDEPNTTADDIEARSRLLSASPKGLSLVVVDYLQLVQVTADSKHLSREQQVAGISRKLKLLPKIVGCPVIILAQLNRESEKENRAPRKSDLRESGAIEQDSDRLWFLYPPICRESEMPASESGEKVDTCLLQDKCRGGPPGVVMTMEFNRPCYRMTPKAGFSS